MQKYFNVEVRGMIGLVSLQGEWNLETAYAYQDEIRNKLRQYKGTSDKVFPITSLKYWSIPPLEILKEVNKINMEIAAEVEFKHNALLAPQKHLKLFEDVVSHYNFENMNVDARTFLKMEEAISWGKQLGYNLDPVPLYYFEELYYSVNS